MAQQKPDPKPTVKNVIDLINQLSRAEQRDLCDELAKLQELRASISVGVDQLDRGEGVPGEQVFQELRARHAELAKKRNQK